MNKKIEELNALIEALAIDLAKAANGNKAAAARARKLTIDFEKLGKEFRKVSIAEGKK